MYRIRILPAATRELEGLDKPVARRIAERINWFAANLDDIRPEPYRDRTETKAKGTAR